MSSHADDPETGERQPLIIRRNSTRLQERQQFQQSQRQVVVDVAQAGTGPLARLLFTAFCLGVVAVVLLWCYIYFGSIYIIIFYVGEPCDQPLGIWLVIWMIVPSHALWDKPTPDEERDPALVSMETNQKNIRSIVLHSIWFGFGAFYVHSAKTCQTTNIHLYAWCKFVIHIYLLGVFLIFVCPLMLVFCSLQVFRLYHALIERGWIANPKGASQETIDKLEIVPYDASLFGVEEDASDMRPGGECCCCQENFGPKLAIVRTICGHYYHKECLGEWLKLAKSCPLCRCDVDDSTKSDAPVTESASLGTVVEGDEELARHLQEEEDQLTA